MHEKFTYPPHMDGRILTTPLEERMRIALDILVAQSPTAKEQTVCYTTRSGGALAKAEYDFTATIETDYGFGATLEDAVQAAVRKYGTADTRRADAIKRIKSEAESLGLTIMEQAD